MPAFRRRGRYQEMAARDGGRHEREIRLGLSHLEAVTAKEGGNLANFAVLHHLLGAAQRVADHLPADTEAEQ
jgi:hypothetical protein